jgi:ribulose-phosphate 3-epimerase
MKPLLDDLDMVTLLAINPGWGGQKFIPSTADRIAQTRALIGDRDILICVDGGVTRDNISSVAEMGADLVVTGSAVFDGKAPTTNARFILDALRKNQ